MTGRLKGKVATITGSTSGIGRETARLFAREGASVVLSGRREAMGQEGVAEIRAAGGEAHFIRADVGDHEQLKALIEGAVERYGRLDILMNNAWGGTYGNVVEVSEEQLDRDIAVSLRAVFLGCKYAIPHMIASGGGAIINTSSVHGVLAARKMTNYDAVKAGILNLTRGVAVDFGHDGVRCNAICPGWIMLEEAEAHWGEHPERMRFVNELYPVGRPGRMRDIANAALFLASEESSFITGHALMVDGGLTIQLQDSLAGAIAQMAREERE